MKKTLTWTIAAIIILAGVVLLFTSDNSQPTQTSDENTTAPITLEGDNAIFVENQDAGGSVTVTLSILADPGFVVIHEDNNGAPAAVIGNSQLLEGGENNNTAVALNRATQDGEKFWAMLHTDNGDDVFNLSDDAPITDSNGNIIMMQFMIGEDVAGQDPDMRSSVTQVSYTNDGFSPSPVTISGGDTITFTNNSSRDFWPASAVHPTHTVYPGSNIQECGTSAQDSIFDSCGAVAPGGTYSFIFTERGEWGYHDHLRPSATGRIIVE